MYVYYFILKNSNVVSRKMVQALFVAHDPPYRFYHCDHACFTLERKQEKCTYIDRIFTYQPTKNEFILSRNCCSSGFFSLSFRLKSLCFYKMDCTDDSQGFPVDDNLKAAVSSYLSKTSAEPNIGSKQPRRKPPTTSTLYDDFAIYSFEHGKFSTLRYYTQKNKINCHFRRRTNE